MPADPAGHPSPGILIALDALIVQRADQPTAVQEAQVALRRVAWIGRPIILAGANVAGRSLPDDAAQRESWVRGTLGSGAYAVIPVDAPSEARGADRDASTVERWETLKRAHGATWLLTDRARQVGAARQAGLRVIVVGPADPQPGNHRPDYQARDLRDAVGHLLTMDVFANPSPASGAGRSATDAGAGA
jgi:hypothetical protein